jgi:hypothetical protein
MDIITVTAAAAAAIALGARAPVDDVMESAYCMLEPPMLSIDAAAGPLLVSTFASRRPTVGGASEAQGQWGEAALRPYDVMSSLGTSRAPALPGALSLADAPAPLPMSNPLAWVLAAAGVLGMLYIRRTQL